MPLETFTGTDVAILLANARRTIGRDAVLLSVRRISGTGPTARFELIAADPVTAEAHASRSRPAAPRPAAVAIRTGAPAAIPGRVDRRDETPATPARRPRPAAPREPLATPETETPRLVRRAAPAPGLSTMTPLLANPHARRNREPVVIALVGPTGAGKTTTIAKLARHPRVFSGLPVGLLCLDTYRVGAVEQLRIYAEIAELPFEVVYEPGDLSRALRRLRDCEILLVDTAGRGPAARTDSTETRDQLAALRPAEVHLTLPAGLQPRLARRVLADHGAHGVTHLIATKLDEFPEDATVFALAEELGLPMRWCTDGQEVPMDLQSAADRRAGRPGVAAERVSRS